MTWHNTPSRNRAFAHGETSKVRWDVMQWTQGEGLDIGCGPHKLWSRSIGIDQGPFSKANLSGDVTKLSIFAEGQFDYVYSSHCLEDIEDHKGALAEWWRVLKVNGNLVLYLPHADHYPNIGDPNGNPAHKHDFRPEDIVKAMQEIAPDWVLRENEERAEGDEYSFLQVYTKRAPGLGQGAAFEEIEPGKHCIVMRCGGFGDLLVAASTFGQLKSQGFNITVYTGEKGEQVLRHDPNVDRIVTFDVTSFSQGVFNELCNHLRRSCDRFINFSETFEGLLLASPTRANFWWPHEMRNRYMDGNYQEAACAIAGVPDVGRQQFWATDKERETAAAWRAGMNRLVVIAATGTGVNKIWPHLFEYAGRLVMRHENLHIAVLGDLQGAQMFEHERLHSISQGWSIRQALALAQVGDLVIGPETGILNAVAHEPMPKIVLLSHSSEHNLTKHWVHTHALTGKVACYPCHRLLADWNGCNKDPETEFAACASAIEPMTAIELTERLLGLQHQAAA